MIKYQLERRRIADEDSEAFKKRTRDHGCSLGGGTPPFPGRNFGAFHREIMEAQLHSYPAQQPAG